MRKGVKKLNYIKKILHAILLIYLKLSNNIYIYIW